MIAVDTNILVYADREESAQHAAALRAVRQLAEGDEAWALPVFCVGEFLRVVSHDRLFDSPTPILDALASIDSLLASPSARLLVPGDGYVRLLRSLADESQVQGNLVFDAQIAAVCLEHGATTLLTEDRDFARFRSLKPLTLEAFLGR
ncbi:MAG: PIN domain-containing protein [Planctomycetaceae bacterium]|jgi:toxin-antitoxin system PIN domain toxin|nr:PIN domain-containing protein [Planctomycetaceae bacterium]